MSELLERPGPAAPAPQMIETVSIIISRGIARGHRPRADKARHPAHPEFIALIADSGAGPYACRASVDMFGLTKDDFIPQVQDIITVGEFYGLASGGQIVFT
jgi:peroxiredoxin family protein